MTQTVNTIRNSKSVLLLNSFREVYLGNKQLSGSNKLPIYWKNTKNMWCLARQLLWNLSYYSSENTYEGVYQEEFFNNTDTLSEWLPQVFINKRNIW